MEKEKKTRRPQKPNQDGAGRRRRPSLLGRLLRFLLTLLLGMAIVIGAEAAVVYGVFGWVTLDRVEEYTGMDLAEGVLTDDSVLRELSLIGLVGELIALPGQLAELTFNTMMEKYGVILSEEVREKLPTALLSVPLSELTGANGLHVAMEHVTFADILKIVGADLIPEPARQKIADRTLDLAADQKFDLLFEGVYLADFVGVTLVEDEDGVMQPVLEEGLSPTVLTYFATIDLGEYFAAEDGNAVLQATLDRTPMDALFQDGDGNFIYNSLSKKMLGDIMKIGAAGVEFDLDAVMDDLYLGEALGYTKGEDGKFYKNGEAATGVYAELVDVLVVDLGNTDIMAKIDNLYVGELMDYEKRQKLDEDGEPMVDEDGAPVYEFFMPQPDGTETMPEGVVGEFASMKVGALRDGKSLDEKIKTLQLGTALGYTYTPHETKEDDTENGKYYGTWTKESEVAGDPPAEATGVLRPLLNSTINNLSADLDDLYLGQVMGFDNIGTDDTPVFVEDTDRDGVKDDGEAVPGQLMASFVSMRLSAINNETEFTNRVKGVRVGYAMGYYYKPAAGMTDPEQEGYYDTGVWYTDADCTAGNEVAGVFSTLSSYRVSEMDGAVKTLHVADALGYKKVGSDWVKGEGADATKATGILAILMDTTLDDLPTKTETIYLGEVMGYEKYDRGTNLEERDDDVEWSETTVNLGFRKPNPNPAEAETQPYVYLENGPVSKFADITLKQLDEDDGIISTRINGMTVGMAMNYTKKADGKWYDTAGNEVENTLLLSIIEKEVGQMDGVLADLPLGEAMGYTKKTNGDWYEGDTQVTSPLILSLADKKVAELSTVMKDMTLGEIMGYREVDGVWYSKYVAKDDPGNVPADVNGYMQIVGLETKITNLNEKLEALDDVKIGQLMDAGLLNFDTDAEDALAVLFTGKEGWEPDPTPGGTNHGWKNHTVDCFINNVIKASGGTVSCNCKTAGE